MPILNGFELCKKAREFDKNIHILFITASEAYYGSLEVNIFLS
jgi:two-component SAPR family response regulator